MKKLNSDLQLALKRVNYQLELKVNASVEKERLKIQKEEVSLRRDEARKRKSIELKTEEFKRKKALQLHRFECMSKVHLQKEDLQTKTHWERLNESATRLMQAQQMQSNNGIFPGIGGGWGSIQAATNCQKKPEPTVPAIYLPPPMAPTQMVPSFL